VSASEFAFLALGLVLGVASGAALVEVLRSRPPARREIRVTVAPNSIPRRPATLADADAEARGPARGGPADRRWVDRDLPPADDDPTQPRPESAPPSGSTGGPGFSPIDAVAGPVAAPSVAPDPVPARTPVPSAPLPAPFRLTEPAPAGAVALAPPRAPVGIAIAREPDPMVAALRATAAASAAAAIRSSGAAVAVAPGPPDPAAPTADAAPASGEAVAPVPDAAAAAVVATSRSSRSRTPDAGVAGTPAAGPDATAASGAAEIAAGGDAPDDACAEQRRVADERCAVATRARDGARAALDALRASQRSYDDHISHADNAAAEADPRAVRSAKEAAQAAFRQARSGVRTRDDVEAAARDWLSEINRINQVTREAQAAAEKHRRAAGEIAATLERLTVEADAARISAEAADEACVAAREAVAACQEAAALAAAGGAAAVAEPPPLDALETDREPVVTPMGSRAGEDAAIIRLLRGDRETMTQIAARLGGDDADARRRWQTLLGDLLEALIARAIESSAFAFPNQHYFWGMFTRSQNRDVMEALASLGFRHDGFGGWADDRVPSQRDLSLAVGYAGLDPMRIRHWPKESEMPDLLREVAVAADEYVWEAAGGLTLGELVSLLGRRADGLAELWNEWGTVRPLLLSAD
jgi:hypothetical protein